MILVAEIGFFDLEMSAKMCSIVFIEPRAWHYTAMTVLECEKRLSGPLLQQLKRKENPAPIIQHRIHVLKTRLDPEVAQAAHEELRKKMKSACPPPAKFYMLRHIPGE